MLKCIYKVIPRGLKKIINSFLFKFDKGEMESKIVRKLYEQCYGIKIGVGSYGCFDIERITSNITIGRYCSFAKGVTIVPRREHPIGYASTHPYFFNSALGWVEASPIPFNELEIGNDVWIGQNAIISSKCKKIGNGSVIGAGSFVNKDVPPYAIVVGSPARVIRYRFNEEMIELLEGSRWYDLSPEQLKEFADLVDQPELFARAIIEFRSKRND